MGSRLFEGALEALRVLPGVGERTARRYALRLHGLSDTAKQEFLDSLTGFMLGVGECPQCRSFSDGGELCSVCRDPGRDGGQLCVVGSMEDMLAMEEMGMYRGRYFILGGLIDPLEGVGPDDLALDALSELVSQKRSELREVILVFSATPAGETTSFYLQRYLSPFGLTLTEPSRGLGMGETISGTDGQTLYHAIEARTVVQSGPSASVVSGEGAVRTSWGSEAGRAVSPWAGEREAL